MRVTWPAMLIAVVLACGAWTGSAWAQETEELKVRLRAMRERAAAAQEEGRADEAAAIRREAEELVAKAKRAESATVEEKVGAAQERDVDELRRALRELRAQEEKAAASGAQEELRGIREKARHIEQEIARREVREGEGRPRPQPPGQMGERQRHVRVAAEHLRAAGMHDMAEELMRHAERMERAARGGEGELGPRPDRPERPLRPEAMRPDRGAEGGGAAVDQLRREVQQLRQELRELRGQVQERR